MFINIKLRSLKMLNIIRKQALKEKREKANQKEKNNPF